MSSFRPEPHVAQQSRRDKLRVQQKPLTTAHQQPTTGSAQFRDVRSCASLYDPPPMFSSAAGVLDFAAPGNEGSFVNPSTSSLHDSAGWIMNCVGGGGGAQIPTPLFPSHLCHLKPPGFSGYYDVSSELSSQKQGGDLHFPSSQLYHNSLQDVVTTSSSTVGNQGLEAGPQSSWVDTGNELLLLPSYGNPVNASVWMNRQSQQWYGEGDFARIKAEGGFTAVPTDGSSTQSLSLSLSSNPLPELQVAQFEERIGQEDLASLQTSRASNGVGFSCLNSKISMSSAQGVIGSSISDPRRSVGPLGPFTGYAAILKGSKFLKPAQQLLDEFCGGSKLAKQCDPSGRSSRTASVKCDAAVGESGSNGRCGNSGASSSSFYSSTEAGGEGGASSGSYQILHPEFHEKKEKLLHMQEEVCRRYKQYHQQMQMVVSSFECVAGLSAATPYASFALKAVSKHFRCLKNLITDQLRHVSKLLGEEFMSSSPGSSKGETTPRLKYVDQGIQKQKAAENSLNFLDNSQPVWRPQRGLPERSVAVLRAWLFDHFLHPYPTDTDKHMLATQTGLSRNQVSNWFINARVRLWKPMVEEIHMLETKGMSEMDLNSSNRNDGKRVPDGGVRPSSDRMSEARSNKTMDCSPLEPMLDEESSRAMEQWHREKRSRMEECGIPAGMDGSLMSFAYQGGMDIGGLGAVSLTLGLRHNEGGQKQQQQMRRHFGSHMVHDFVG